MQNKFLYQILCVSIATLMVLPSFAQDMDDFLASSEETLGQLTPDTTIQVTPNKMDSSNSAAVIPDLKGRQAVDFPARPSLDTLELAPLPGIYETDITGPAPLGRSVSEKDMPSERLLGRLTPEVFQEMAQLERDNTFLKLQIQKATMKNDLEKLRANYRQARLDEIAKREDVVRTRIQWWQEQEKIRQDLEAQRAAADGIKAENEEKLAEEALAAAQQEEAASEESAAPAPVEEKVEEVPAVSYVLLGISGIHNTLSARIKNPDNEKTASIQVGDTLADGSTVEAITPTEVILKRNESKRSLTFENM